MAIRKLHVRKDDMVMVTVGKEKGKTGKVLRVFPTKGRLVVESLNMIKRHQRPTRSNPDGGIVEKEAAMDVSNVMLMCPTCSKPSRTGMRTLEDGNKVRFCKKCNEIVDK